MTRSQFPLKAVATSACCVLPAFQHGPTQQPSFHCCRSKRDNKPKRRFEFHQCWVKQKLQHLVLDYFVLMCMYALLSVYFMQGLFHEDDNWSSRCAESCWVTRDGSAVMSLWWILFLLNYAIYRNSSLQNLNYVLVYSSQSCSNLCKCLIKIKVLECS